MTRHNGRAGTHGTYNPKHNDRSFDLANSEHIDPERAKGNIYWDCFHGFRSALDPQDPDDLAATFSEVERQFYESSYSEFIEKQNERNAKIRHTERNRSIPDLLSSRKTCPEETIYQMGTLDEHASAEDLMNIVTEFIEEFKVKYGEHVHVLDWALHLDESTPHIHERHVFDCENKYGEVAPQQEKALEALGFELPDPDKPLSRRNNRKITFDAACRKMLFAAMVNATAQNSIDEMMDNYSSCGNSKYTSAVERDANTHQILKVVKVLELTYSGIDEFIAAFRRESKEGNFTEKQDAKTLTLMIAVKGERHNRIYMMQCTGAYMPGKRNTKYQKAKITVIIR